MKKIFQIVISALIFTSVSANDGVIPVKSRVIFKKNPSQSEIEGWEKEFFKKVHQKIFFQNPLKALNPFLTELNGLVF